MASLGYASILIAWVASFGGLALAVSGAVTRREELAWASRRAVFAVAGLTTLAMVLLVGVFLARDFAVRYVYTSSSEDLSTPLTIAAVYSGQRGSLLFWAWMLSVFAVFAALATRRDNRAFAPAVMATTFAVEIFFLSVLVFISNPFERFAFTPEDGLGLNPLLVDSGMLVHPPLLLSGFVSTTIPFAFAVAALVTGRLDTRWLVASRRFALVSWTLLSAGNLMGAWWAYHVLGWGGYWGWDPVENSAILPWFAMTAYLHSVMVQERRGMLKTWNLGLISGAFLLAMLGTFNVRSGVLTSVHSFAESALGPAFFTFFLFALFGTIALMAWRSARLKSDGDFHSLLSREAGFVVNNFLFLAIILVVLGGTFYPLVSEAIRGERITVGPAFFNQVNGPLLLALIALTGIGPVLPWRSGSPAKVGRALIAPAVGALVVVAVLAAGGVRGVLPLVAFGTVAFTGIATLREFLVAALARRRMTGEFAPVALGRVVRRDHRRFGGYTVHLGITVMALGIAGSTMFQTEERISLAPGETATVGRYELTYRGLFGAAPNGNGVEERRLTPIVVSVDGAPIDELVPERHFFANFQEPTTKIPIRSTPIDDLYIVLQAFGEGGRAIFVVFVNPLVFWLWVGGLILLGGAWMTLWPNVAPRRASAGAPVRAVAVSDAQG